MTAGATTPERLPAKHWNPVQRPAAFGPASVCAITQVLEAVTPKKMMPSVMAAAENFGSPRTERPTKSPARASPPPQNVLRATVGVAPRMIQRSESQPENIETQAPRR